MVDFRYHLISLIAVILALALGILAGSGFLGGPLLDNLQRDVNDLRQTNADLRGEVGDLSDRLEQSESFAQAADRYLTQNELQGERVVIFQLDGSDGALLDGVKRALIAAGAEISSEITLADKLALTSAPDRDQLALALASSAEGAEELRLEAVIEMGERAAASAVQAAGQDSPSNAASQRVTDLYDGLENTEFVGVQAAEGEDIVPPGANFVVLGGSPDRPAFDPGPMIKALGLELSNRGAPTFVVEDRDSTWGLVAEIRTDAEARSAIGTVDNGDTTVGHIAIVLGLEAVEDGTVGHFGYASRSSAVIPEPQPVP